MKKIFTFDAAGALMAVAVLLPFERVGSLTVAGLTVRPSQLALLAALAFAVRGLLRRETSPPAPKPLVWLAAFLAAASFSLVHSDNFQRSLLTLAFTVFTASLAWLVPRSLTSPERLRSVRNVILVSAAAVGLFGLWQFLGDMAGLPTWLTGLRSTYSKAILGFTRIQSTAYEPLYFADYLLLPLGLALAWLMKNSTDTIATAVRITSVTLKRLLWLLVMLMTLNLFLTSSRGGYAGFIAMLAVLAWSNRRSLDARRVFGRFLIVGAGAVAVAMFVLSAYAVTTRETLADTFFAHVSTLADGAAFDERAATFAGALEAFRRHPWIGVGFGGYGPAVAMFPFRAPEAGWPIVNNEYMEVLAETGVLGLALFLLFLLSVLRTGSDPRGSDPVLEAVRIGALAALAGMLTQYLTFSTLYVMHIWFTIGLVLACSRTESTT